MLNFPNGFSITSTEPIDSRLVMTKAEMLAVKKAKMPQVYLTVCVDDGQLYIYNSANTLDEETGRFRRVESSGTIDLEQLAVLISPDEDNLIKVTDNGLKVSPAPTIGDEAIKNLFM